MKKRTQWLGVAALALAAGAANAAERGQFRITPRIGLSQLKVDGQHREAGDAARYDGWAVGISAGYRTSFGLVVEIGTSATGEPFVGWALGGELRERHLAAGYDIEFAEDWHFIPKIGLTDWELKAGELDDLVDGAGEERDSLDGADAFFELAFERILSEHVAAGLSLRASDAGYGSATSAAFTFTWSF